MAGFWIRRGTEEDGPYDGTQLKQRAASGDLTATDFVRKDESDKWVSATKVKGLFGSAVVSGGRLPIPAENFVTTPATPTRAPRSGVPTWLVVGGIVGVGCLVLIAAGVGFLAAKSGSDDGSSGMHPGGDGRAIDMIGPGPSTSTSSANVDVLDLAKEGSSTSARRSKEQSTAPSEVAAAKQTVVLIPEAAKASGPDDDRLVIKKTAYLKTLKTHLIGRQDKEVVALLGRPPETDQGGRYWFYVFHTTDSVTGALYNHIQVNFSDDDGRCYLVSIGQTKVRKTAITDSEAAYSQINKSAKLQELKKQLVGQTTENVVARMGKPVEVENGDLFYVFHARDVITGAVYRHIQVHLDDATGRCYRVSIGQSSVGP